jgi:transcriptional regulator with XRE-family HTH domain
VAVTRRQSAVLKTFGASVRRLRSAAGLTQAALAERVDLELRSVQKVEAGQVNVPVTTLVRLEAGLGCGWEELLGKARVAASKSSSD